MHHSVWVAHYMNSNHMMENISSSDAVPDGVLPRYLSFQRIWQGKGAQTAACKVLVYLVHSLLSYVKTYFTQWSPYIIIIFDLQCLTFMCIYYIIIILLSLLALIFFCENF